MRALTKTQISLIEIDSKLWRSERIQMIRTGPGLKIGNYLNWLSERRFGERKRVFSLGVIWLGK